MSKATDEIVAEVMADWQKKLLQLDRRNNLLYFKPGRAIEIVNATVDGLTEQLVASRNGLSFDFVEPPRRGSRGSFSLDDDVDDEEEAEPVVIPGDIDTLLTTSDLLRRLRILRRKDREWEEEQGLNVLFLATGFLEWIDQDGQTALSPLILIPCDLAQNSPRDPFYLQREGDDAEANPTLMYALSQQGVDLPDFDDEAAPSAYIRAVQRVVAGHPDWQVRDEIFLGTFAFSKMPMWRDLEKMRVDGISHALVRSLAGDEDQAPVDTSGGEFPNAKELSGGGLDDLLDIREQNAILPADFSQLKAMEVAKSGANMVIHGPPGTGKSQTITNIIAALLADGQRVLFVSEKTAALDVVKRRLEDSELGVFCLDLHSERSRKASVYEQLRQSVEGPQTSGDRQISYDALEATRQQLNNVVRALHTVRSPLGKTVFQMQGLFAKLRDLPECNFELDDVANLDEEALVDIQQVAERIARRSVKYREHYTSRWLPLKISRVTLQLADTIRKDMAVVVKAAEDIQHVVASGAEWLGVSTPDSDESGERLADLIRHFLKAPGVPSHWVLVGEIEGIQKVAQAQQTIQRRRQEIIDALVSAFGTRDAPIDFAVLDSKLDATAREHHALHSLLGDDWNAAVIQRTEHLVRAASTLESAVVALRTLIPALSDNKGDATVETWGQLVTALERAGEISELAPVPDGWTKSEGMAAAQGKLVKALKHLIKVEAAEEKLGTYFKESVLGVVDEDLLARYTTEYPSFFRRLGFQFRRDQRLLRGHTSGEKRNTLEDSTEGIRTALELRALRSEWDDLQGSLRQLLGHRFNGRETDWKAVGEDMDRVGRLLSSIPLTERGLVALLLTGSDTSDKLELTISEVNTEMARVTEAIDIIGRQDLISPPEFLNTVRKRAQEARAPLVIVAEVIDQIRHHLQKSLKNLNELKALISGYMELTTIEKNAADESEDNRTMFGARFDGFDTDWTDILAGLAWSEEVLEFFEAGVPQECVRHIERPEAPAKYEAQAESIAEAHDVFVSELHRIEERFDPARTPWGGWHPAPFTELVNWSADLSGHADTATDWIAYQIAVRELNDLIGENVVEKVRDVMSDAEQVPGVITRRVSEAWLDKVWEDERLLGEFVRQDHDHVRDQFRDLDRKLPLAARSQIRSRCFSEYPDPSMASVSAGQLGTLRGELSKRRRQLPVRKLILRIPNLLQTLKPLFLMSPLAVSKFLPRDELDEDAISFDAVIFDEASQVFPEDAVPAIARGARAIVVGDAKQLPPTNFFRRSLPDDEFDDDDDDDTSQLDAFAGRDSILDVMKGMVGKNVAEAYLETHYRSRHDNLIRFSNHSFYDDRLLVFPTPDKDVSHDGIRDIYLPDARYEPKGGRVNRGEAERAVAEVFELMRTRPNDESIGVVALNRPQADLIWELAQRKRLAETDVEERFSEDLREPFFVKNLENVQGDERDHIILSIGYGPTAGSGTVYNRFGPINRDGGERRLNVAVTRARRSMTVIHSLRPSDIHSEQPGALHLRRYLEYVANPLQAFESQISHDPAAEPESPFEEAVEAAIRRHGLRVDHQVGVAGYRIDLGILSEDGTRYDLGIECDGATYHSAPAARDRDWLRQSVLERLGWTIHRIWSTSWIRNPEGELDAIVDALARARAGHRVSEAEIQSPVSDDGPLVEAERDLDAEVVQPANLNTTEVQSSSFFEEYVESDLSSVSIGNHPEDDAWTTLEELVLLVVAAEMPVHQEVIVARIRIHYDLGRAGSRVRPPITRAISTALRQNKLERIERDFLVLTDRDELVLPRRPKPSDQPRKIEHISLEELGAGLIRTVQAMYGSERRDLIVETARQLGYNRTADVISTRLDRAVDMLLENGGLTLAGDMLSSPRT